VLVEAFLAAARQGDFDALLALLDPEVVLRDDRAASMTGVLTELRGGRAVARKALTGGARAARPALVNGAVGVVVAPQGRLLLVLGFTMNSERITAIEVFTRPARLRQLNLAILSD
jgi:hypothetical protein